MAVSCLNHRLISDAVTGTSVNVTKLINALTPLCPKPEELLANHIGVVVAGYICGFLPWGFLVLFDFISGKWKTVRATRRAGRFHIIVSVLPMMPVIAYAVLQGMAEDYKEMMTAVVAVLLTLYHTARTVWGLAQLGLYKTWCYEIVKRIRKCNPKLYVDELNGITEVYNHYTEDELDTTLMVNEDIVDNEFTGGEVAVTFNWKKAELQISDVPVCVVRWGAAFQCSLGHLLNSPNSKHLNSHIRYLLASGLFSDDGTSCVSSLISFSLLAERWIDFESYEIEFDSIVSSYPVSIEEPKYISETMKENRKDANLDLVQMFLRVRNSSPEILHALQSQHSKLLDSYGTVRRLEDAWILLQNQMGIEKEVEYEHVHWFYKLVMIPMFGAQSDPFVLQASAYSDIVLFINRGEEIWCKEELRNKQLAYGDEFESCKRIFQQIICESNRYALGASLDSVRSLLAQWVLSNESNDSLDCWNPPIPFEVIRFDVNTSQYLLNRLDGYDIIYLSQHALFQEAVTQNSMSAHPSSASLIMLFLVSYPALHCVAKVRHEDSENGEYEYTIFPYLSSYLKDDPESWEKTVLTIEPVLAPQKLSLTVTLCRDKPNVSIEFSDATKGMKFEWQNWINAAMAILKTYNEVVKGRRGSELNQRFVGPLDLIKPADLSQQMLNLKAPHDSLPDLHGTLSVWTGWPLFDVRFCQFELNQWLDSVGPLPDCKEDAYNNYKELMDTAKNNLKEIASWNRS